MANSSSKRMWVILILSLILPYKSLATDYVVCDGFGWNIGADVQLWLSSLPAIQVGDTFYFYFESPQTVALVDEIGYLTCDASQAEINDESCSFSYTFNSTGVYWFISSAPGACAAGLNLQVFV